MAPVFALRAGNQQDASQEITIAKSTGDLQIYKNVISSILENNEMLTHGMYHGQSEIGDLHKLKKKGPKITICTDGEQNNLTSQRTPPTDCRSAVLETGPAGTNGPYSNEVEANQNIQNVAHPTNTVSRKRSSRAMASGNGSDSDSDSDSEYNKLAKSPCQSSDESEESDQSMPSEEEEEEEKRRVYPEKKYTFQECVLQWKLHLEASLPPGELNICNQLIGMYVHMAACPLPHTPCWLPNCRTLKLKEWHDKNPDNSPETKESQRIRRALLLHSLRCAADNNTEKCCVKYCKKFKSSFSKAHEENTVPMDGTVVFSSTAAFVQGSDVKCGIHYWFPYQLPYFQKGAYGEVTKRWIVKDRDQALIAVKKVKLNPDHGPLESEINLAKSISGHVNVMVSEVIIRLKDNSGLLFMELGQCSLHDYKRKLGRAMIDKECVYFMRQVAQGIHFMQQNGFLHGDIKAQNVILTKGFTVAKLADFDAAVRLPTQRKRRVFGTPGYAPYEVFEEEKPLSFAIDVYSFTITICELIFGREMALPYEKNHPQWILLLKRSMQQRDYALMEHLHKTDVDQFISEVICKGIQEDPTKRISMTEVCSMLARPGIPCAIPSEIPQIDLSASHSSAEEGFFHKIMKTALESLDNQLPPQYRPINDASAILAATPGLEAQRAFAMA